MPDLSNAVYGDDIKGLYENTIVNERLKVSREKEKQQKIMMSFGFAPKVKTAAV